MSRRRAGVVRQTVELIVVLCLCVLLFRTFSAEAYVVPTGSMAPTLLGQHREIDLPELRLRVRGRPRRGRADRHAPVCPNCGETRARRRPAVECSGDRVLVQKFLYDFRRPRRVGSRRLPLSRRAVAGVRQAGGRPAGRVDPDLRGDVFIDGKIARKSLARAPGDADPGPRQPIRTRKTRTGSRGGVSQGPRDVGGLPSGWSQAREWQFVHAGGRAAAR